MRDTSLASSAAIQLRVIYALVMREVITRYGRNNIGFLWMFVQPMLFTAGITYIWSITKGKLAAPIPVATLALTGYSTMILWRNTTSRCLKALESNNGLLSHRNVMPLDVYLARIILEIAGASVSLITLTIAFCAMGKIRPPADILTALGGWSLLSFFSLSLGLLVGGLSEKSEFFSRIWGLVTVLLFPFSGAALLVDWVPPSYQKILLWVPMVHGAEMIREGYCGAAIHSHYSLVYLLGTSAVVLFISLILIKRSGT